MFLAIVRNSKTISGVAIQPVYYVTLESDENDLKEILT